MSLRSKANRNQQRANRRALSLFADQRTKLADYQLHFARIEPLTFAPSGRTVRHRLNQVNLTNALSPRAQRDRDVL